MATEPVIPPASTLGALTRGLTVREVAWYLRLGRDRVRELIRRGELGAIDTGTARRGKPRWVILPHHLAEFARRQAATAAPKPAPRRRGPAAKDYYPD
jgi:excisionase family DNA binding protein